MEKKVVFRNVLCSLLLQGVTILSGFIIPKIILNDFGSEVNGLISSINQFLNYIQLLEGGLSGVVMAALYKPLHERDDAKISAIIKSTQKFFRTVGMIYVAYAVGLGFVYPLFVHTGFSYGYSLALVLVLAMHLFVQYFFSLTYKLLLNADRKVFFVSLTQTLIVTLNMVSVVVCARLFHDVLLLKLASGLIFVIQPVFFTLYVRKHYNLDPHVQPDESALKQRWDGFGINLAYFVHTNTDMVILTIFSTLTNVSIYSVYLMIVNALKNLIVSISQAIVPSFGKLLAENDREKINSGFDMYEFSIYAVSTILFTCGMILVTPFVMLYTNNITDANYNQPLFGVLLALAEMVYCIRDPYVAVSYAAGRFRQISKYAYTEAILNIVISLALVSRFHIVGIAIGTLVSMLFRMAAHIYYVKKHILYRSYRKAVKPFLIFSATTVACCVGINHIFTLHFASYFSFVLYGAAVFCIVAAVNAAVSFVFFRPQLQTLLRRQTA